MLFKEIVDGRTDVLVPNKCPSVCPDARTDDGQWTPDIEGSQKLIEHFVLRWAKKTLPDKKVILFIFVY